MRFRLRRRTLVAVLVGLPLALLFAANRATSWRPVIERVSHNRIVSLYYPDGRTLLCGDEAGATRSLLASSLRVDKVRVQTKPSSKTVFSPDGRLLFAAIPVTLTKVQLQVSHSLTGRVVWSRLMFRPLGYGVLAAFSPGGSHLLLCDTLIPVNSIEVVDLKSGQGRQPSDDLPWFPNRAQFSPDGSRFLVACSNQAWKCYDTRTLKTLWTIPGTGLSSTLYPVCFSWSKDGKTAALCYDNGQIVLRSARNGQMLRTIFTAWPYPTRICFSPDGRSLLVGDGQGRVALFSSGTGRLQRLLSPRISTVTALAFSSDGSHAAIGRANGEIETWRVQ